MLKVKVLLLVQLASVAMSVAHGMVLSLMKGGRGVMASTSKMAINDVLALHYSWVMGHFLRFHLQDQVSSLD